MSFNLVAITLSCILAWVRSRGKLILPGNPGGPCRGPVGRVLGSPAQGSSWWLGPASGCSLLQKQITFSIMSDYILSFKNIPAEKKLLGDTGAIKWTVKEWEVGLKTMIRICIRLVLIRIQFKGVHTDTIRIQKILTSFLHWAQWTRWASIAQKASTHSTRVSYYRSQVRLVFFFCNV